MLCYALPCYTCHTLQHYIILHHVFIDYATNLVSSPTPNQFSLQRYSYIPSTWKQQTKAPSAIVHYHIMVTYFNGTLRLSYCIPMSEHQFTSWPLLLDLVSQGSTHCVNQYDLVVAREQLLCEVHHWALLSRISELLSDRFIDEFITIHQQQKTVYSFNRIY